VDQALHTLFDFHKRAEIRQADDLDLDVLPLPVTLVDVLPGVMELFEA